MTRRSKKSERVLEVETFGSAIEFPTLPGIINMTNELPNSGKAKVAKLLNKINNAVISCKKIEDLTFQAQVLKLHEKKFYNHIIGEFILQPEIISNEALWSHLLNYNHAKFNPRLLFKQIAQQQKLQILKQQKQSAIDYINTKKPIFHIFGSKSSQDYDVVVYPPFVLGSIAYNSTLCKKYEYWFEDFFEKNLMPKKKVNVNLALYNDGRIINVHKGTYDEVNNSVLTTYTNHKQFHPLILEYKYIRGGAENEFTHLKVKRCLRFIISFFSRVEELRPYIKVAMKGNVDQRLDALRQIDLRKHTDFSGKKEKPEDIYKVIAFQLAQTLCLVVGVEIFSKEDAMKHCPQFTNALMRNPLTEEDLNQLQISLQDLILTTSALKQNMKSLDEPIFNH
jgi:hypothetical protein